MITLKGSSVEIGEQFGRHHLEFCKIVDTAFVILKPSRDAIELSNKIAPIIEEIHPSLLDEVRGLSRALGEDFSDVLPNVIFCGTSLYRPLGCIGFGLIDELGPLIGLNYEVPADYDLMVKTFRSYYRIIPEGFNSSIIGTDCYLYPSDGLNEKGLSIVSASLLGRVTRLGLTPFLINRILLDTCSSVDEAIDLMKRIPHMLNWTYILADENSFAVVEVGSKGVSIFREEVAIIGNFFHSSIPDREVMRVSLLRNGLKRTNTTDIEEVKALITEKAILKENTLCISLYRPRSKIAVIGIRKDHRFKFSNEYVRCLD